MQLGVGGVVQNPLHRPISALSPTTGNVPIDADDQLVPRSKTGDKFKAFFRKIGNGIKHVAQKIGNGIKKVAQKIGNGIKKVAQKIGSGIKKVAQKIGSGIKKVAQKIGSGIKRVAQKIGRGIKKVAQKIGSGIKKVAQKIGSGIKKAAQKVGHFMKTTFKKIAKFGLKIISVVEEVAGKVVGFIPGLKPVGKAMEAVGKVAGFASDRIHADLGSKLDKGMAVMDKAETVLGYIPRRRRDLSEVEDLQQRDGYFLEERHDIPLAYRELESYFDADERDFYERAFDDYYLDWE